MKRLPSLAVFCLLCPAPAAAEELPVFPLRDLIIRADAVVLATPLNPTEPGAYRIQEVFLAGKALGRGDTVTLPDTSPHNLRLMRQGPPPARKPRPRPVAQALLFLKGVTGSEGAWKANLVLSGVRLWTRDGEVCAPEQLSNPGDYLMVSRESLNWGVLVRQVRREADEVERVRSLRGLLPAPRRNRALFRWIDRHRHEFGRPVEGPEGGEGAQGWGPLEVEVFRLILDGGVVEDSWRAVRLHAELYQGHLPPLEGSVFGNPAGRELLLRVAIDGGALMGDRLRALELLRREAILAGGEPSAEAQKEMLGGLLPLLKDEEKDLRIGAARVLEQLASAGAEGVREQLRKEALPALETAYRRAGYREARSELAGVIYAVGGAEHWAKLTGNPQGVFVRLRDLGRRNDKVFFWLSMDGPADRKVHERPTLVLKRVRFGLVVERKMLPLPAVNPPGSWEEGWSGTPYLLVEFSTKGFTEGTWRVSVEGTAGKDKAPWKSEPWEVAVTKPKNPRGEEGQVPRLSTFPLR
jgi:hypothetical protein